MALVVWITGNTTSGYIIPFLPHIHPTFADHLLRSPTRAGQTPGKGGMDSLALTPGSQSLMLPNNHNMSLHNYRVKHRGKIGINIGIP